MRLFAMNKYNVYILISKDRRRTYTGYTCNLNRRIKEHNSKKVVFSSKFSPYDILHVEEFENKIEAIKREKYFKSTTGRRKIKEFIEKLLN